jgi:hypothetical protein
MGAAALPILTVLTVASTAYSFQQSKAAGKVANAEAKIAANREGDAARQREIERRRTLLRSLASQNAGAGATGVDPNMVIAGADIQYAADDFYTDQANTAETQSMLRLQGKNAQRAGRAEGVMSLFDGATDLTMLRAGKKP